MELLFKMKNNKISLLAKTEFFFSCTGAELEIIAEHSDFIILEKGEKVFGVGEIADRLYIVAEGEIVIRKDAADNKSIDLARFLIGDGFGELDMLTLSLRTASAFAAPEIKENTKLLVFPKEGGKFEKILEKHPFLSAKILHKFLVHVSGRIRKSNMLIKENSPIIQELSKQVYGDKLTGLFNKTYLEEKLKEILLQPDKKGDTALIMMKPDNFKEINDTYGHAAGDQVLKIIGSLVGQYLLKICKKEEVILFRYIGNELAILLSQGSKDHAYLLAEQLMEFAHSIDLEKALIEEGENNPFKGCKFVFSVSFGIAIYPYHAASSDELIEKAHELPLIGRSRGGNKILFPEDK